MNTSEHISTPELISAAADRNAYSAIEKHLKECEVCNCRFHNIKYPTAPEYPEYILPNPFGPLNNVYELITDNDVHGSTVFVHRVVAINEFVDTVTSLSIAEVSIIHDLLSIAAKGDILTASDDLGFDAHIITSGSYQIPKDFLGSSLGQLSSETMSRIISREGIASEDGAYSGVMGELFQEKFSTAIKPFTDDLERRRNWKLYLLNELAEDLPVLEDAGWRENIAGYDEMIIAHAKAMNIYEKEYAKAADKNISDEELDNLNTRFAKKNSNEGKLGSLLVISEKFNRTGKRQYLSDAANILEDYTS